ncbi:hypothetical protein V500_00970 [Pseudogymnoascus sp. VKM F-4518 (FW-2643)]|nr:hypothetical protein V500_00970 [Pseudogymnoascus sp. VKM F-4518 (FW-2643)]
MSTPGKVALKRLNHAVGIALCMTSTRTGFVGHARSFARVNATVEEIRVYREGALAGWRYEVCALYVAVVIQMIIKLLQALVWLIEDVRDMGQKVLDTLQDASPAAPFPQLPTEILVAIFNEVDDIDQLALALSCKRLLEASTLVSLKSSVWTGYFMKPDLRRAVLSRLVSPTTKTWNTWKVCSGVCTAYRPTQKRYWKAKADLDRWAVIKANEPEMMLGAIKDWKHNPGASFCPLCNLSDARSLVPTWPTQQVRSSFGKLLHIYAPTPGSQAPSAL